MRNGSEVQSSDETGPAHTVDTTAGDSEPASDVVLGKDENETDSGAGVELVPDEPAGDTITDNARDEAIVAEQVEVSAATTENQAENENVFDTAEMAATVVMESMLSTIVAGNANDDNENDSGGSASDSSDSDSSDDEESNPRGGLSNSDTLALADMPPPALSAQDCKSKNETLPDDLPFTDDLPTEPLPADDPMVKAGAVMSVIGSMVIVQGNENGDAVDSESILWTEERKAFGRIFEVFGPIVQPFYSIRFLNANIAESAAKVGQPLFYAEAPEKVAYTKFVPTKAIEKFKGTDASNDLDEEPNSEEIEFSDDEAEALAKRNKKIRKRQQKPDGDTATRDSGRHKKASRQANGGFLPHPTSLTSARNRPQNFVANRPPPHQQMNMNHQPYLTNPTAQWVQVVTVQAGLGLETLTCKVQCPNINMATIKALTTIRDGMYRILETDIIFMAAEDQGHTLEGNHILRKENNIGVVELKNMGSHAILRLMA